MTQILGAHVTCATITSITEMGILLLANVFLTARRSFSQIDRHSNANACSGSEFGALEPSSASPLFRRTREVQVNRFQMKFLLECLADVAVGAVVVAFAMNRGQFTGSGSVIGPLTKGDPVPMIESVRYRESRATVVLFLSSQCRFCTESMAFYRGLKKAIEDDGANVQMVALSAEPLATLTAYLEQNGLHIRRTGNIDRRQWPKLRATDVDSC